VIRATRKEHPPPPNQLRRIYRNQLFRPILDANSLYIQGHGANDFECLDTTMNLEGTFRQMSDFDNALEYFRKGQKISRWRFGAEALLPTPSETDDTYDGYFII